MKPVISALLALVALAATAHADQQVFTAAHVYTLTGRLGTDNRFGNSDYGHFEAGDILTLVGVNWTSQRTLTAKGIAIFDLGADGLGKALKGAGDQKVLFSFILDTVQGEPRPLRVEYIGTTNDLSSEQALTAQFERGPIHRADHVLDLHAEPGIKVVDATSLLGRSLTDRYLVIRFEQEGMRRQVHSKDGASVSNDLYVFRKDPGSVRITLTGEKDPDAVSGSYEQDGYANLLPDLPTNLTSDMGPNPITDMSSNPTADMPENILSDMPKNLITDEGDGTSDAMN